jgi:hypothetical protein
LIAEGGHVVALIYVGVQGTENPIVISDHWDLVDGEAVKLRAIYFDPQIRAARRRCGTAASKLPANPISDRCALAFAVGREERTHGNSDNMIDPIFGRRRPETEQYRLGKGRYTAL